MSSSSTKQGSAPPPPPPPLPMSLALPSSTSANNGPVSVKSFAAVAVSAVQAVEQIDLSQPSWRDVSGIPKPLYHIRWNCDGTFLSAICADRTVKIFSFDEKTTSLTQIQSIPTTTTLTQACWHPQERTKLALCGDDKSVELWEVRASRAYMKIATLGSNLNMSWSCDGKYLALGNKSDTICIYDAISGNQLRKRKFPYEVNELAWTAQSESLFAATAANSAGSLELIEVEYDDDLRVSASQIAHSATCFCLCTHVATARIAVSGVDCCVTLWHANDLIPIYTITLDSEARCLSFSGDGRLLAICCDDTAILLCDGLTGKPRAKLITKVKPQLLAWNPQYNILAMSCDDKSGSSPQFIKLVGFPLVATGQATATAPAPATATA